MAKIRKVLRFENHDTYGLVVVQLEDGDEEYTVFVGGEVETMHHWGRNKAFVKKGEPNVKE